MTTAILSAGKWLSDGPLPTRHPGRRLAGIGILVLGMAALLASGAKALLAMFG